MFYTELACACLFQFHRPPYWTNCVSIPFLLWTTHKPHSCNKIIESINAGCYWGLPYSDFSASFLVRSRSSCFSQRVLILHSDQLILCLRITAFAFRKISPNIYTNTNLCIHLIYFQINCLIWLNIFTQPFCVSFARVLLITKSKVF